MGIKNTEWFHLESLDDLDLGEMYFVAEGGKVQGFGEYDGESISVDHALYYLLDGDLPDIWLMVFSWPPPPGAKGAVKNTRPGRVVRLEDVK